jgi:hypothetical protein
MTELGKGREGFAQRAEEMTAEGEAEIKGRVGQGSRTKLAKFPN